MLSLERRYAKVVRAYERLKELYDRVLLQRDALRNELRESRLEVRDLRKELKQREYASRNTLGKLVAALHYNIAHLYKVGDIEAAEKLEVWRDHINENLVPVADVRELVELLRMWADSMPLDDPGKVAQLYMRTRQALNGFFEPETRD